MLTGSGGSGQVKRRQLVQREVDTSAGLVREHAGAERVQKGAERMHLFRRLSRLSVVGVARLPGLHRSRVMLVLQPGPMPPSRPTIGSDTLRKACRY